ncbi:DUF6270 domain-containing protein [Alicyclobacillus kakegawensis]|uniref:DUF6270 domain-containing protein n=1 Tax=Alicyclobacillus kakegawensis TaxID=392012 RepID=UPI00082F9D24|nr:DUF6270 domain-containing protein [Alicyclobacillus kakegawensis]
MTLINVAVLGCCATRDVFNSRFNPHYRDFYNCGLTQNQSSIISLMSDRIEYDPRKINNLSDYDRWNVETEFTKEFLDLLPGLSPDYLLIDFFADVHFGCIQLSDTQYITNNRWKLWKTSYYKELEEKGGVIKFSLQQTPEAYFNLWKTCADRLFHFIHRTVPDCKIIIHKARNVDYFYPRDGAPQRLSTSGRVQPIDVEAYNEMWSRMDEYVVETYGTDVIDLFSNNNYLSYEEHPWGPFYVHYTMNYYHDFLRELHKIVVRDDRASTSIGQRIMSDLLKVSSA